MEYNGLPDDVLNTLKLLIDKHGVASVIAGISSVCDAKGEHIRENWQDGYASDAWFALAKRIDRFAHSKGCEL